MLIWSKNCKKDHLNTEKVVCNFGWQMRRCPKCLATVTPTGDECSHCLAQSIISRSNEMIRKLQEKSKQEINLLLHEIENIQCHADDECSEIMKKSNIEAQKLIASSSNYVESIRKAQDAKNLGPPYPRMKHTRLNFFKKMDNEEEEEPPHVFGDITYKTKLSSEFIVSQPMCSICTEEFSKEGDFSLLSCGHIYRRECLEYWMRKKKECPICRAHINIPE
ncbi:hypothetical protein TRFO_36012 [Tritrichomonas foetus]|uniref:RING-type domain-containing protein n=1 Tax=Tritrichomonas foetus TaxID=1144522 RepID=A0A1J4JKF8_9EUKA|nr:hypothetical protein TRFO_36012 [Tritrichomonas foetus]|eukprot:OHS97724.1 hypothetical protein TRFO_36012 [Tritrichomonas foetus]